MAASRRRFRDVECPLLAGLSRSPAVYRRLIDEVDEGDD
jgi:hypothetical protein